MRSGQNPNIDDDTRARARRFVEDAGMPKPAVTADPSAKRAPVVTKKMLADSGYDNLRDYMNAQRGLTRRGMSKSEAEKTLGLGERVSADDVARAKKQLNLDETRVPRRAPEPLSSTRKPGTNVNYENTDTSDMSMKRGGKVKGYAKGGVTRADGIAQRGHTKGRMR